MDDQGRTVIRAILHNDLNRLLASESAADLVCPVCGRHLTEDEVGGFVRHQARLVIFCDRPACLASVERGVWDQPAPEQS